MIVDVSNLEDMIRGYVNNTIKEYYPDIDTSKNSIFDDLFIKPIIEFSLPFIDELSRLELKSNLSNVEYLTDEEVDEIGEYNYFMSRKQGSQATTMLTLSFYNLNLLDENFEIKIPSGCTFATSSGLEFQTQEIITLKKEDIQENYNRSSLVYEIEIPVIATDVGTKYNVMAGEIIVCKTFISNSLLSVINNYDVVDGRDKETNTDFIDRIRDFYLSRQLGTKHGYRNFIMNEFDEITDVYVSGYKDEYMNRDLFKVIDTNGDTLSKHLGGAVDLYLKGCLYTELNQDFILNNDVLLLECKLSQFVEHGTSNHVDKTNLTSAVTITNLTYPSLKPTFKTGDFIRVVDSNEFFGEHPGLTRIEVDNTDNHSYIPGEVNNMHMVYSYQNDNGEIVDQEVYFDLGLTQLSMDGPVKSIDYFLNIKNSKVSCDGKYSISRTGIEGTTQEKCTVTVDNTKFDDYFNGLKFSMRYTVNKTLLALSQILETEENRIVTADVLGLEAKAVPVNMIFKVKTTDKYRNADRELIQNKIKSSIMSYFNKYKLGDQVEESDLVGWMYTDNSINDIINYVALPFDAFYIPENINDPIATDGTQQPEDGILPIRAIDYPILNINKFKVEIIQK